MEVVLVFVVLWCCMIGLGMYVGSEKGRGSGEGFLLAFLFGPFGILIEALLPSKISSQPASKGSPQVTPLDRRAAEQEAMRRYAARVDAERKAEEAEAEKRRADRDRKRIARREALLAKGVTPGPLDWAESLTIDAIRWYKGAGDMAQMFVLAAAFSIPAAVLAFVLLKPR